jgi:hypothetical protein
MADTVTRVIEVSEVTLSALEELAAVTGVKRESLGELFRDALRTYEWIMREQSLERSVGSFPDSMLAKLNYRNEEIRLLPPLFQNVDEVRKYFQPAA